MKGYNYERRTKEVVLSMSLGQLSQAPKLTLVALNRQMPPRTNPIIFDHAPMR
jgi:hypothetical protein